MMPREKTTQGAAAHALNLKESDKFLLLGDSHIERMTWRFPQVAPEYTWLCGIGGDKASQLSWRIHNDQGTGYTQNPVIADHNHFERIGIMIGSNDISSKPMKDTQIEALVQQVVEMREKVCQRWPNAMTTVFPIPPVPLRGRIHRNQQNVEKYNQKLTEFGLTNVEFQWELDLEDDFEDHVHLSESGYFKFRSQMAKLGFIV